ATACTARASSTGTQVNSVTVDCFNTSGFTGPFSTAIFDEATVYSGNGGDTITIDGEFIDQGGSAVPITIPAVGSFFLSSSPGLIQTLGGADTFSFDSGQIGDSEGRVNIDLGSEN